MKTMQISTILVGLMLTLGLAGCANHTWQTKDASSPDTVTLTTAQSKEYGTYLADQNGRALYLLEGEMEGNKSCKGHCLDMWPPLIAPQGAPAAGSRAVRSGLVGVVKLSDGSMQVTYNGHRLYYYVKDHSPGQTTGQDVTDKWGEWYLVTPSGNALEEEHHDGGS